MAEAARTIPKHCAGTKRYGDPCTATTVTASGFCFAHDPDRAGERIEARRKGGQNRSNAARLGGLVPPRLLATFDTLEQLLGELHDGRVEPRVATAMAAVAGAMTRVLSVGELEQRLRDLEERTAVR